MLPKIVDAVHGRNTEVHIDSGIRSGQDVLRAVALGANAAYIGRPYLYGLGAYGRKGVSRVLEILRSEFDTTMALVGERDVACVGSHILEHVPQDWLPSSSHSSKTRRPREVKSAAY